MSASPVEQDSTALVLCCRNRWGVGALVKEGGRRQERNSGGWGAGATRRLADTRQIDDGLCDSASLRQQEKCLLMNCRVAGCNLTTSIIGIYISHFIYQQPSVFSCGARAPGLASLGSAARASIPKIP